MAGLCEGRVVIVTGGARGIGREHCLEFARQGARIVVNDLGSERTGEGRSSEPAEALAGRLAEGSHVMPVYSATLNVAPKTLQIVGTTQGIEAIEAWAARVGRLPQVRWATIAATARAWRDAGAMASRINP